ncbi:MAG: hypothetical protein MUF25_05115 [Pirellulaceae bacterium]|nr:hypothetical protein [Pirellulaceae bacterium]
MIIDHYRELMNRNGAAVMDVRYVVERDTAAFEAARTTVGIACADDSLTGWNNFGPAAQWPYRTYPNHPNGWGAKIIAEAVFQVLPKE